MEKPYDEIPEEEGRLLELLSVLIDGYENRAHPLPKAESHKMLAYLLQEKGMKPSDLWTTLPKSRVSEMLSGKRTISKAQAKQLAELPRVPVDPVPPANATCPRWAPTPVDALHGRDAQRQ